VDNKRDVSAVGTTAAAMRLFAFLFVNPY